MNHPHHIRIESAAFLHACTEGPHDAPVPSCPDWTVRDLLGHLGTVQHFHGGHLGRGVTDQPPGPRPTPPEDGLAEWVAQGTETLLANLAPLPDDAPAWTFQHGNHTVGFWRRRMAHEAAIHRWDAQRARGAAEGFDTDLALDGVGEYLDVFLSNRRHREEPPAGTITLIAAEGRRYTVTHGESTKGATITGPAEHLYLAVWGRMPLEDLAVEGDLGLAASIVNA